MRVWQALGATHEAPAKPPNLQFPRPRTGGGARACAQRGRQGVGGLRYARHVDRVRAIYERRWPNLELSGTLLFFRFYPLAEENKERVPWVSPTSLRQYPTF